MSQFLQQYGYHCRTISRTSGKIKQVLKNHFDTDDKSISNLESVIHLIKGTLGIAVLTIPIAVSNAGLLCGTLWMVFAAVIMIHCIKNVVVASQRISGEK